MTCFNFILEIKLSFTYKDAANKARSEVVASRFASNGTPKL